LRFGLKKENISSMTGDGEVMLSILASFAQEESTSLSRNIKWTVQKKYKEGKVHSHQKMLGYEWHGDEMTIVPEEAETVRFIFDSYIAGKSTGEIARERGGERNQERSWEAFPAGERSENPPE
jgi:hypothetical protein